MVAGIGVGTTLAINGAVAHAFVGILYKALLFMSLGAVLHRVGTAKGSELGGLYKSMPLTTVFCLVGCASISAFPLFCGFITKSMIITAVAKEGYLVSFVLLLFASACVFHYVAIKIPHFAFFGYELAKFSVRVSEDGERCGGVPVVGSCALPSSAYRSTCQVHHSITWPHDRLASVL